MKTIILLFCVFLLGCGTVGSYTWHKERLAEYKLAYENGEITKAEYLNLVAQADQTYATPRSSGGHVWVHPTK